MRTIGALWMVAALLALPVLPVLGSGAAQAGEVTVVDVAVEPEASDRFAFAVTLRHADEGWDHYAYRWDVVSLDGKTVYGERVLYHPHVTEQPFTRSLSGVVIPPGVREVVVRGHDKVHGLGGPTRTAALPGR